MKTVRIAHLSDLHFAKISTTPRQFLSKQWVGNFNLLLFRRKTLDTSHLKILPSLLKKLNLDLICITGDFTTTASEEEFDLAKNFVDTLQEIAKVYLLPGNHDVYTKQAEQEGRFFKYFSSSLNQEENLQKNRIALYPFAENWWLITLDTTQATPLFFSKGTFFEEIEPRLKNLLKTIPPQDSLILANHFPLFETGHPRHDLARAFYLQNIIKAHPSIKLYLHGHDHRSYILDRQKEGFPLIINAGSCSNQPRPSFYLLDINSSSCCATQYQFYNQKGGWLAASPHCYTFPSLNRLLSIKIYNFGEEVC